MMKKDSKRRKFGLGLFVVSVMVLISCTLYLTYAIINNLYSDDVKINETTANYISFLFEYNSNHIINIKKPKVVNDDVGKLLIGDDYYSIDINIDEEQIKDKEVEYVVTAEAVGKTISEDYIKFYVTDDNLTDTAQAVVYGDLEEEEDISGKIIYRGVFTKENTNQNISLRVWVSDEYEIDDIAGFSYQLNVAVKNS